MNGEDIKTLVVVFGSLFIVISLGSMFASTWRRKIGYILAINLPMWFIAGVVIGFTLFFKDFEDWQIALSVIFLLLPMILGSFAIGASIGILIGGLDKDKKSV